MSETRTTEQRRVYFKTYAQKNLERRREYARRWREANRQKVNAYAREWRSLNVESVRASDKAWRENNPHKLAMRKRKRKTPEAPVIATLVPRDAKPAPLISRFLEYRRQQTLKKGNQ